MYNYYVVTTEQGDKEKYSRVGRGPVGEWTVTHYWDRGDRRWYPVACTYAGNRPPGTRYPKRKNAHLAMRALVRQVTTNAEQRLVAGLSRIQRRSRAAHA
jgi:hypothetical protein